jgi:hypothetical protein
MPDFAPQSNPNQSPEQRPSLLAQLGFNDSEEAAHLWRREHDRRERLELMAAVARDQREVVTSADVSSLERELRLLREGQEQLRAELRAEVASMCSELGRLRPVVAQIVREILIEELPEAVEVIIGHYEQAPQHCGKTESRNGKAERRR